MRSRVMVYLSVSLLLSIRAGGQNPEPTAKTSSSVSPVGRWKTVDDATGKVKSIVVIWEENSDLYGRIEELVDSDPKEPDPRCDRCQGELKNARLIGLRIIWNLQQDGGEWPGGKILDPDNGKIYPCHIMLKRGGKELKVRGFIAFSLIGRTQYWLREE